MNATTRTLCGFAFGLALLGTSSLALAGPKGTQAQGNRKPIGAAAVQSSQNGHARGGAQGASGAQGNNARPQNGAHPQNGARPQSNNRPGAVSSHGGNNNNHNGGNASHGGNNVGGNNNHGSNNWGHDNRGHDDHRGGVSFEIHIGSPAPRCDFPRPIYRPVIVAPCPQPTFAQLEYQNGYESGQCDGYEAGKVAGFNGLLYCGDAQICFDRFTTYFESGYMAAYSCSYREGYIAGQRERTYRLTNPTRRISYGW